MSDLSLPSVANTHTDSASTPFSAPFSANGQAISEAQFQALALSTQHSVVIEACAGSGKTWLLVARILKLLLQGVSPAHIVAITFTRKAAQEMKARLADMLNSVYLTPHEEGAGLLAALNLGDEHATRSAVAAAWQLCFEQGQWPSLLTFHEWFGELRQDTALSNLANAGATLCDDEAMLTTQAWQQFWQDSRDAPALNCAMHTGVAQLGVHGFEQALNAFLSRRAEWLVYAAHLQAQSQQGVHTSAQQAQAAFVAHIQPTSTALLWAALRALAPRLNAVAKHYVQSKTATPLARGQALLAAFEHIKQAPEPSTDAALQAFIMRLVQPLSLANGAVVNTKLYKDMLANLTGFAGGATGFEAQIDALHAALQALHHQASVLRMIPVHEAMLVCGAHLVAVYQGNKQARGLLDFTDLEIDAFSVLTQSMQSAHDFAPLAAEKSPTRHVLLDEFQDTNPVQWQALQAFLLPLLREAQAGGQAASVLVVGDPKQSIYRFRRADPQLFAHVQRRLHTDFGAVLLKTQRTRRNSQAVNQWVNAVFASSPVGSSASVSNSDLFSPQFTLSQQAGQGGVLPVLDAAALEAGDSEAQQVLRTVLAWKSGNPQLDWSQVMVLARKRQALAPIAAALRGQGIASVSTERGGFFAQPEIADVMHVLAALHNPADALALLSALRSPLFAITDAQLGELLVHSAAAPGSQAVWLGIAGLEAVWAQGVAQWLAAWHTLATSVPMHDALDAMMHHAQWAQRFAAAAPERRVAIEANLAQLLQLALSVNQGRYPSLARFVQAVAQLRNSDALAAQASTAPNAVRLSTIHSAKGLEADCVVIIDGYAKDKADDTLKVLLDWPAQQAHPSLFALQLCAAPVLETIAPLAQVMAAQEQARLLERDTLLYVAMTRAVNALWLSATAKKNTATVYERLSAAYTAAHTGLAPEPSLLSEASFTAIAEPPTTPPSHQCRPLWAMPAPPMVFGKHLSKQALPTDTLALGTLMHSLLEHALRSGTWHCDAALSSLADSLGIQFLKAQQLRSQCQSMANTLNLLSLRGSASYLAIEETLVHQGQRLRPDAVAYEGSKSSAWVLDFKYSFSPQHASAQTYAQQVQGYVQAICAAGYTHTNAMLLTLAGECWQCVAGQWQVCPVPWGAADTSAALT